MGLECLHAGGRVELLRGLRRRGLWCSRTVVALEQRERVAPDVLDLLLTIEYLVQPLPELLRAQCEETRQRFVDRSDAEREQEPDEHDTNCDVEPLRIEHVPPPTYATALVALHMPVPE